MGTFESELLGNFVKETPTIALHAAFGKMFYCNPSHHPGIQNTTAYTKHFTDQWQSLFSPQAPVDPVMIQDQILYRHKNARAWGVVKLRLLRISCWWF